MRLDFHSSVISFLILILLVGTGVETSSSQPQKTEDPERVILVKDYKWRTGGKGRQGIIEEITLENRGEKTYKDIEIEVDFYTANDLPLGSLRSTVHETLPPGSQKTFRNVQFGIMHSELENTIARVSGAELVEEGAPSLPKDLISVKDWDWSGGQYGTEGILKEITVENKSGNNYKHIELKIAYSGTSGGENTVSKFVIQDVLPANSERTFRDVNVGFRDPNSNKTSINVLNAEAISAKELRYRLAEKGELTEELKQQTAEEMSQSEKRLSLAERYRERLAEEGKLEEPEPKEKETTGLTASESPDTTEIETKPEGKKLTLTERYKRKLAKTDTAGDKTSQQKTEKNSEKRKVAEVSPQEKAVSEEIDTGESAVDEVPLPRDDIVVHDFEWGSGVPGTIGVIKELSLKNLSGIKYTKIEFSVEFYSQSGRRPLGSKKVTLYEILPPHSVRTFENIEVGLLNLIPESGAIEIKITDAAAVQ